MTRRGAFSSGLLGVLLVAASAGAAPRGGRIGFVPDPDPERHERLLRIVRLAAAPDLEVVVGEGQGHWQGTAATVRNLLEAAVDVLLAPPDRAVAHLVAQIATRRHVPAIELAWQGSPDATSAMTAGSFWLVHCERPPLPPPELEQKLGASASDLEIAAWNAVVVARRLLRDDGFRAGHAATAWRSLLPPACRDPRDSDRGWQTSVDPKRADAQPSLSQHRGPTE